MKNSETIAKKWEENNVKFEGAVEFKFDSTTTTREALGAVSQAYRELPAWAEAEWGKEKAKDFHRFIGAFHWADGCRVAMAMANCFSADEDFGNAVCLVMRLIAEAVPSKAFSVQAVCESSDGPACDLTAAYAGSGYIKAMEVFYPCGRLVLKRFTCPECSAEVVSAADCNPKQIYICPECGAEVNFEEECTAFEPICRTRRLAVKPEA